MSDPAAAVAGVAEKLLIAGVQELLPLATGALPVPISALLQGVLALPFVQSEIKALEDKAGQEVELGALAVEAKLKGAVDDFLKKHPALEGLWQKVAPAVQAAAPVVVSDAEKMFGPKLAASLEKLKGQGRLGLLVGTLETELTKLGVL